MSQTNGKKPTGGLFATFVIKLTGQQERHIVDIEQVFELLKYAGVPMQDVVARIRDNFKLAEKEVGTMLAEAQANFAEVDSVYDKTAESYQRECELAIAAAQAKLSEQMYELNSTRDAAQGRLNYAEQLFEDLTESKANARRILETLGEELETTDNVSRFDPEDFNDDFQTDELDLSDLKPESTR